MPVKLTRPIDQVWQDGVEVEKDFTRTLAGDLVAAISLVEQEGRTATSSLRAASAITLTGIGGTPNAITARLPDGLGLTSVPLGMPLALRGPGTASDVSTDAATLSIPGAPPDLPILDGRGRPVGKSGEITGSTPLILRLSGAGGGTEYRVLSALIHPADLAATTRVAEDAFAHGAVGGEFHSGDDEPLAAILGEGGVPLASWDARGRMLVATEGEFYGSDDDSVTLAYALDDGRMLLAWDAAGALIGAGGSGGGDGPAPGTSLGYVAEGALRVVAEDDRLAAPLGPYRALSVMPGHGTSVRAVIDQPALGPTRSVTAGAGWLIPDAAKVLHVIIGLGQSLMVGSQSSTSLISIAALYPEALMFTRADGRSDVRMGLVTQDGAGAPPLDPADLTGFEPLVAKVGQGSGGRGETPMEAAANALARQARDLGIRFRSLSFTAAMGGTAYAGLRKGTQTYANMLAALSRAKELAEAQGWRIIVDGCLVKHGEGDQSSSSYLADLIEWRADIDTDVKAITGQQADVHFVMGQPSSHTTATPHAIQAMLEAHDTSPHHHLAGPDYPFADHFAPDYLHLQGPGYVWGGEQMARAWKQALWSSHRSSRITRIIAAARAGATVTLDYEVPVPPLVIDRAALSDPGQCGFRFRQDGGAEIAITDVALSGPAQVTLTLASAPAGTGGTVDYAHRPQSSPRSAARIPRGNLRDSAQDISHHAARPLHNWAVHQSFAL